MKHIAGRILIFLLFIALAVFLFCYAKSGAGTQTTPYLPFNPPPEINDPSDNAETADPDLEEKYPEPTFSLYHYLKNFPEISPDDGFVLTDAVYDNTCSLFAVTTDEALLLPEQPAYTVEGVEFFTLWPRMGYIILADGTQKKILSPEGNAIPVPEGCDLSFFPARTSNDIPLFKDWSANGKYVTLSLDGTVTDASYDERVDSRGCAFDYPSYYGKSDSDKHTVNYSAGRFGYTVTLDTRDAQDVPPQYKKAYAYSDGFGCATDGTRLYFYNSEGRLRIGTSHTRETYTYLFDPNTPVEKTLGYFYFDEGLTRVTKKPSANTSYEVLLDRNGNAFPLPADFSLYSYSNGMILLEKEGRYGYMTSRGKWICAPEYTYARPFFEGLAVVGDKNGKKGVIDRNGKYVIDPVFDEITDCSGGVICAYSDSYGWKIFNKRCPLPRQDTSAPEVTGSLTE